MKTIPRNSLKIHTATEVIEELGITPEILVALASRLKCVFLIKIPDNTIIYLKGTPFTKLATSFAEAARHTNRTNHSAPLEINSMVTHLCIRAPEVDAVFQIGELRKKTFQSVALFDGDPEIRYLNANQYAKRFITNGDTPVYMDGQFYSCVRPDAFGVDKHTSIQEKSITIGLGEMYISCENLQLIREELNKQQPTYGKFKKDVWVSTKLALMNEASTHFFSNESTHIENSQLREEIKQWFTAKWGKVDPNVLEQAANAILPDERYPNSRPREAISDALRAEYNDYASTALIIINETAKKFWKEMQLSERHIFAKNDTIKDYLKSKYKLTARLVGPCATIIRPDKKQ